MPRKGPAPRRELVPDPVYRSVLVTQLVNKVLLSGKKTVAERAVYEALDIVGEKTGGDPVATLKRAVDNIRPSSRCVAVVSVAPPIRCRSRFVPVGRPLWPSAGW